MKLLRWAAYVVVMTWILLYAMAIAVPYGVMELLYRRGGEDLGYNSLAVTPLPDASARAVVRPSPDLLYAMCIFNLSDGPLYVEAPVPERYWSMQFYQMNTDNFAGISNQRDQRNRVGTTARITLIGPGDDLAAYSGEVVQSPTRRGVMLLRVSAIGDPSPQERALEQSSCGPVDGGRSTIDW